MNTLQRQIKWIYILFCLRLLLSNVYSSISAVAIVEKDNAMIIGFPHQILH